MSKTMAPLFEEQLQASPVDATPPKPMEEIIADIEALETEILRSSTR